MKGSSTGKRPKTTPVQEKAKKVPVKKKKFNFVLIEDTPRLYRGKYLIPTKAKCVEVTLYQIFTLLTIFRLEWPPYTLEGLCRQLSSQVT